MLDTEMMYILQVYTAMDVALVLRATMGTMLAGHTGSEIYVAQDPADMNRACLIMAKDEYNKRLSSGGAVGNIVTGTGNAPVSNDAERLLKPYRREHTAVWVGD